MPVINEVYSDNPQFNYFGVVTGTVSETQFPSGSAKLLRFKTDPDNLGTFFIGTWGANNCVYPLDAGDDTGWLAPPSADGNLAGLSHFSYRAPSGSIDYLYYWAQK